MESYLLADTLDDYEKAYKSPLLELVRYSLWITLAVCGIGVLLVAVKIVVGYLDGNPQREAFGLFWVLGGCLLAISATSIAAALLLSPREDTKRLPPTDSHHTKLQPSAKPTGDIKQLPPADSHDTKPQPSVKPTRAR